MDPSHSEVERRLLVGLERQVGKIEHVRVDPIPELLIPLNLFGEDGNAFISEKALVALKGLTPGIVVVGITRDTLAYGFQRKWLTCVEQDQDQIGESLEPIKAICGWHERQPMAA